MLQSKARQFVFFNVNNRLLGLFGSLLAMQWVLGRDLSWSLGPGQLPDSSSMAGRWNPCSSCRRQRIPSQSKTYAWSSLRRKCSLQLMLLMFELINNIGIEGKGYDRVVLDSAQSIMIYSEERDSTHWYRSLLLAFGTAYSRITQLWLKFPCANVADVFSQMLNEMHPVFGVHRWEKTWGVWQQFIKSSL